MIKHTCFICLIFTYAICNIPVEAQEQSTKFQPVGEEAYQVLLQIYQYDKGIPLNARIVEKIDKENCVREKIVFTGIRDSRVPGYLAIPKKGKSPYPCVLLLHGFTLSKSSWWDNYEFKSAQIGQGLLSEGFAVLALDMPYHGERSYYSDYESTENILYQYVWLYKIVDCIVQSTIEYRRALDYLVTRADIDSTRIGVIGQSAGGVMTFVLTALEPKVKVSVATVTPHFKNRFIITNPTNFAPHISSPFLMLMGRNDEWYTVEEAEQLYDRINSSIKNIIWYDSGHYMHIDHVDDALNWFKEHL